MIFCKRCGQDHSTVTDSRKVKGHIVRRRTCVKCGFKWKTAEIDYWTFEQMGEEQC